MTAQPLLDVNDLTVEFATRRGIVKAVQHVNIIRRQGRDARHRRRIRFRQVGDILRGDEDSRPRRQDRRGLGDVLRHRRQGCERKPDARPARPRNLDDLPEPAGGAQSDPQGRRPDRGRAAPARAAVDGHRSRRKGDRGAGAGQDRASARALSRVSVRTVRRHVPACRDRAGAGLQSAAPDRGRADHRPRRDHAEGGDGPDRRADQAAEYVDHPDHPRSRPRRRLLRPRDRDGKGPRGGDREIIGHLRQSGACLHQEADARDAAGRRFPARPVARGRCRAASAVESGFGNGRQ